jgi:DNA-directed RNA polymerase subunit RPC12/RpoP
MARINFETRCPCGWRILGSMKKPTLLERSVAPIKCASCGSRFLMVSKRISGEKGRLLHTEIEIIELSKRAKEAIESKLPGPIAITAKKVAKFLGVDPNPDTSASIVETEMDTPAE